MAQDWRRELARFRAQLEGTPDQPDYVKLPREVARRYACPECDAKPGSNCRGTNGARKLHPARFDAAWAAGERYGS